MNTNLSDTALVRLGDTQWSVWPEVSLRSAGFPAELVTVLADRRIADAADSATDGDSFLQEHRAAVNRQSRTLEAICRQGRFREAVAWQNPKLVHDCVDRLTEGKARNARRRGHELTVANYVQRYTLKNDTVGFFGPVGWAQLRTESRGLAVSPGTQLLVRRSTYFENWAIDELARALADEPTMLPYLTPQRVSAHALHNGEVRRSRQSPVELADNEFRLIVCCDGQQTISDLAAALVGTPDGFLDEQDLRNALQRLRCAGVLRLDLEQPIQAWPERALRTRLSRISDERIRTRVISMLDELITARDTLAAGSGDADKVLAGFAALDATFRRITGSAATRRHGRTYAGRTLIYQDTVRDVSVHIGRDVMDALAPPLGLVLDSARWLVHDIAERYRAYFLDLRARRCERTGVEAVPLGQLIGAAATELTASRSELPATATAAIAELRRRWQQVLRVPDDVRSHTVTVETICGRVAEVFGMASTPWWSAGHHSPDIMLAASSPEAVDRGEFLFVLGELHLAFNALESRLFTEQHPEPARLAAALAQHRGHRIYPVLPKSSPFVTSRLTPPSALLTAASTYWSWASCVDSVSPPAPIRPAADLVVRDQGGRLVVQSVTSADEFDFIEVIGEILSGAVVNAFSLFEPAPHRPRVTIDQLVLCRESWTFIASDTEWAFAKAEHERFAGARSWRLAHGISEQAFFKVPVEDKPTAVDFTSPVLVEVLAKAVRKTAQSSHSTFSVSEMLPGINELWLPDSSGQRYTSEFRFVAVHTGPERVLDER